MPPPPALSVVLEDDLPDMACFLGSVVFFLAFFSSINDIVESEELTAIFRFEEFEYTAAPVYLALGLGAGFLAYALAYAQFETFFLLAYGHTALEAVMTYFLIRHVARVAHLSPRRSGMVAMFSTLPIVCLAALQAEHVSVKNCRFFYSFMVVLSVMPLGTLLREWRSHAFDASVAKHKKRLFYLAFCVFAFVASTTPSRSCRAHALNDHRQAAVLMFDVAALYASLDSVWGG